MAKKIYAIFLLLSCIGGLDNAAAMQDPSRRPEVGIPDPSNASIVGRITLPSGSSADVSIRVTLSNEQSILSTLFSDKNGEFRFSNLLAGTYYLQVSEDRANYRPTTERVRLYRGQELNLTFRLSRNETGTNFRRAPGLVSALDYDDRVPGTAKKEYTRAIKLIEKRQFDRAVEHFKQAVSIFPEYVAARNDLGVLYLWQRRFDEAAEQFLAVVGKNPRYYNSRFNLGLMLVEQGKPKEAIPEFERAISINGARPEARYWLGVALFQTYDSQRAERELTRALITGGSDYASAHYYLARISMIRGERSEAAHKLRIYLEEAPQGDHAEEARLLLKHLDSSW